MVTDYKRKQICSRLLGWYVEHQRDLPWRRTEDPYNILVSEVMLQQTQVSRVLEKYREFLHAFPTVQALAKAKTSAVIKTWKGLGYNRRALFLQRTAQAVVNEHGGTFPQTLEALVKLPGVGDYTARAILSFALDKQVPMMDTNHRRFYSRVLHGIKKVKDKDLLVDALVLLPKKKAYDWNQALMDFGSSICLTRKPRCEVCPLQKYCKAYPDVLTEIKPKKKKVMQFKETDRYFRGRIIDMLRAKEYVSMRSVVANFADISKERVHTIISKLERDGLIYVEKQRIMLPK